MSTEYFKIQASKQYFELRNELNRSNKSKNQKTDLEFLIRQNEDEDFYKYMFIKINQLNQIDELNINDILRTWLFQLWIS